jgi:hypothetical protein
LNIYQYPLAQVSTIHMLFAGCLFFFSTTLSSPSLLTVLSFPLKSLPFSKSLCPSQKASALLKKPLPFSKSLCPSQKACDYFRQQFQHSSALLFSDTRLFSTSYYLFLCLLLSLNFSDGFASESACHGTRKCTVAGNDTDPRYLLNNMGEASPCRTEKRKAKRRGRKIATIAVLTIWIWEWSQFRGQHAFF